VNVVNVVRKYFDARARGMPIEVFALLALGLLRASVVRFGFGVAEIYHKMLGFVREYPRAKYKMLGSPIFLYLLGRVFEINLGESRRISEISSEIQDYIL
jgi:hypothetical protein